MSNTRKRRSPAELLEAQTLKLNKLKERAALEQTKAHPEIERIQNAVGDLNGMIAAASRNFAKGPQSFETRQQQHKLWLDEIEAGIAVARLTIDHYNEQKKKLLTAMGDLATNIRNGGIVTPSQIDSLLCEAFEPSDALVDARSTLNIRKQLRADFKAQFKKEDRETMEEGGSLDL
jgi:hypothetical protein